MRTKLPTSVLLVRHADVHNPRRLFYGRLPGLGDTVYTIVAAVAALALGAFVFNRVDDQIAVEV